MKTSCVIYDIEKMNKNDVYDAIFSTLLHQRGTLVAEQFLIETSLLNYSYKEIIETAKKYVDFHFEDQTSHCLYCDEPKNSFGSFCDETCKELFFD